MTTTELVLALTSLGAATVNGAIGYGYSSISVPIALFVIAGRVLNPAIVIVEVAINLYALVWNRHAVRGVLPRVRPLAIGLVPGVIVGALLLHYIPTSGAKFVVYFALLPLILIQASGRRWPIRREKAAALPFGAGVGMLYGLTTISGPPLALFWNNQGLGKAEFRVALAVIRAIESVCALIAYAAFGLLSQESMGVLPWIVPGVLIGFPVGHWLIRKVQAETFRRVCISLDAYLVSFGLARVLIGFGVAPAVAYQLVVGTLLIDGGLLWSFFVRRSEVAEVASPSPPRLEQAA